MTKNEVARRIAEKTGETIILCEKMVNNIIDVFSETLESGQEIDLIKFGSFKLSKTKERQGINHLSETKEVITFPSRTLVKFKSSNILKEKLNPKK